MYWVGVRDLNNRHFHGDLYPIDEGCTYNAYLVVDDEVTLLIQSKKNSQKNYWKELNPYFKEEKLTILLFNIQNQIIRVDLKKSICQISKRKSLRIYF